MALQFLLAKLVEPKSAGEDDRRHERILNIILLGSIATFIVLDAVVAYYSLREGAAYHEMSFVAFSIIPAFFVVLYSLSRRGYFAAASYLLIAAYFVSISYAAYRWGVNLPAALLGYAFLITMASILIGSRFGFVMTAVISGFMLVLWHAQFYGIAPPLQKQIPNNSDALVFAILFGLLTMVAWLSNREIEKSLLRARKSEAELKEERDLLEVKVEERTHELRETQLEKIDHLYRFAEFGELASGLFHDVLTLLNAVSLRAESKAAALGDAAEIQDQIERFRVAVRNQLSREDTPEHFSLAASIEHVIQLLSYEAKRNHIRITFDRGTDGLPEYFGSPFQFHRVIMNLLSNAIESYAAVPESSFEPDAARVVAVRLSRAGSDWVVHVEDNGCGVPEPMRQKIFEPFFTTKGAGRGTGIGLAMTKRIVENNLRGVIEVACAEGGGAVFTVRFPSQNDGTPASDRTEHRVHQEPAKS